jgi:hypothetical protein
MARATIKPPAPPDLKGARAAEKAAQPTAAQVAHAAQAQTDDEETQEQSSVEEIRSHLIDAVESAATALQLLDDLEARSG